MNPKRAFALMLGALLAACAPADPPVTDFSAADIALNNRGVALMGQFRYSEAEQAFAELVAARPDWLQARVNHAIATLNRQQDGDEMRALAIAEGVIAEAPEHLAAHYVAALMQLYVGNNEVALERFSFVAGRDPDDAHALYYRAQALLQMGDIEGAAEGFRASIELDPYLRSAYYGAGLALRRSGDPEAATQMLALYHRFDNHPRAQLAEFRYTRMGRKAEAKAVDPAVPPSDAVVDGPLFAAAQVLLSVPGDIDGGSLTTVDIDGDGRQDLFLAGGRGHGNQLWRQTDAGFALEAGHPLAAVTDVVAVAWGDIDNSGRVDAFLCRHGADALWMQAEDGWVHADVPGLDGAGECVDVALFDADHDGDLDLFVLKADRGNELFNNNLDGSFRRLASDSGLDGGARASRGLLALDLDGDRDVDLVVLHGAPPHQVFVNDRLWDYRPADGFDDLVSADLVALSAADLDADGQMALIGLERDGSLRAWRADEHRVWRSQLLARIALEAPDSAALATLDLDGDGRAELLVHHRGGFEVWKTQAHGEARLLHREALRLHALTPILIDPARGPSLAALVADDSGMQLTLWSPGSGRHAFMAVAPSGRSERGEGMRSNASGIGTGLALRVGDRWSMADTYDRHSAPGQSLQPLALGLGGAARADFLELFWTDGVYQTELELAAGLRHDIAETQRQLASCPILFAWNGERFEFVSDLLGVAGIGFLLEPGRYSEPRPWEFFRFPEGALAARDGRYQIRIGEPMEEIAYLDTARLHVHDLPPGWSLTVDERMHTGGGPVPSGAPLHYREDSVTRPLRAYNDRGEDVTAALLASDAVAAPPGDPDPRFLGRLARDHVLTLDFGVVVNPPGSRAVLKASGWVEYPYSQTLFSAWQAGAAYRPPSLDAFADGAWHAVFEHFGYPAGMPREMSLPLDALPPGTTQLRIHGNWEVYWDSIAVVHAEAPPEEARATRSDIGFARVAKPGFARRDTLAQRRPYYDYEDRAPFWDTRYPLGHYTALGPVTPLVAAANDAFAVIGPGEEIQLEFDAPPPPPEGWRRVLVLEVRGYAKDMDLYTRDGETVGPLPSTAGVGDAATREALHARYLTRFQGGR